MNETILFEQPTVKAGKVFYDHDLPTALEHAKEYAGEDGHVATLPEIGQARSIAPKGSFVWTNWFSTASGEYKGRSKQGNAVYVVAHGVGPFTEPGRIRQGYEEGLLDGAGKITQDGLYALLEQAGNGQVTVLDFDKVKKLKSGVITVDSARDNPLVRARLGEHTEAYLNKLKEVYGNEVGNWHDCASVDLDAPSGRVLFAGDGCGLDGDLNLDYSGRFVGVRAEGAALSSGNEGLVRPSLEQVLQYSKEFVPEKLRGEFKTGLERMYEKE